MHSTSNCNSNVSFERDDAAYMDVWPIQGSMNGFSFGHLHQSPSVSFSSHAAEQNSRSFIPIERYFVESKDDPFCSVMEPDPYCDDDSWFHNQNTHSRTWSEAPIWDMHRRIGSPDDTIQSSTSGSGYYQKSHTERTSSYDTELPWLPSSDSWQPHAPTFASCQNFGSDMFDAQAGSGIALREIQSYPDHELDDCIMSRDAPKFNMEPDENIIINYTRSNPSPAHGIRENSCAIEEDLDFEDVQTSQSYDGDSDYKPPGNKTTRRQAPLRKAANRRHTIGGSYKISKSKASRIHRNSHDQSSQPAVGSRNHLQQSPQSVEHDDSRPFSCPLAPYGCHANFTSKNEWKRHVTSQHICLGFWRCDMCQDVAKGPNDFNRKDLFIQHVRRMHSDSRSNPQSPKSRRGPSKSKEKSKSRSSKSASYAFDENLEKNMDQIKDRCWKQFRKAPGKISCAFCDAVFSGSGCTEEWLEHAGRHIAASLKSPFVEAGQKEQGNETSGDPKIWERDTLLRKWLVDEGIIERYGALNNAYVLVDKNIVSEAVQHRSLDSASYIDAKEEDD